MLPLPFYPSNVASRDSHLRLDAWSHSGLYALDYMSSRSYVSLFKPPQQEHVAWYAL